ncbi:hypothetical protein QUB28_02630 [Microcoleus sp. B4-C3]
MRCPYPISVGDGSAVSLGYPYAATPSYRSSNFLQSYFDRAIGSA